MINILFVAPVSSNGGIASWAKGYLKTFNDDKFRLFSIDSSSRHRTPADTSIIKRIIWGLLDLVVLRRRVYTALNERKFEIMHIATSGDIGSFRDIIIAYLCKKRQCKTILHCHYGCIISNVRKKGIISRLTKKAFSLFDQIWVLDKQSFEFLNSIRSLHNKVFLTPNPININYDKDLNKKDFTTIAFIGNIIPSKGIYELVRASLQCRIHLDIIGPGKPDVIEEIKQIAGNELNCTISIHGMLPNEQALQILRGIDILALPTYYPYEAFPISILEAMSLSKMVISTNRAAIPDMLTMDNGARCGIIVREKSIDDIADAIMYCQNNKEAANEMCQNAYDKVKNTYSTEKVHMIYKNNYSLLLENTMYVKQI